MATNKSNQLRDVQSLTFAATTKIQTTVNALKLQLELPDLEDALPTICGLLESVSYYAQDLANDVDLACEVTCHT